MLRLLLISLVSIVSGELLLDLSHDLAEDSMIWPNFPRFEKNEIIKDHQVGGFWLEYYNISFGEHMTTHMDAPSHFAKNGYTVDQIPLRNFVGQAVVMDITEKVAKNPLSVLDASDVISWEKKYGLVPDNGIVFVRTGWGSRYGNETDYYGIVNNNVSNLVFPGIGVDAARIFSNYPETRGNKIVGVGIDTASMDPGNSHTFDTHVELYSKNIYGLENVAHLETMPITGAEVTVLPIKTRGGSGGPTRIIARIPTSKLVWL